LSARRIPMSQALANGCLFMAHGNASSNLLASTSTDSLPSSVTRRFVTRARLQPGRKFGKERTGFSPCHAFVCAHSRISPIRPEDGTKVHSNRTQTTMLDRSKPSTINSLQPKTYPPPPCSSNSSSKESALSGKRRSTGCPILAASLSLQLRWEPHKPRLSALLPPLANQPDYSSERQT
jgi:hypothetical protein